MTTASDDDFVDPDWLRDQITKGAFDDALDDIESTILTRRARREPWNTLFDICAMGRDVVDVGGQSSDRKVMVAVDVHRKLKHSDFAEHPSEVVQAAVRHLQAQVYVLLGMSPEQVETAMLKAESVEPVPAGAS